MTQAITKMEYKHTKNKQKIFALYKFPKITLVDSQ